MDLYIKVPCTACNKKQKTWYGRPCPYCVNGRNYIIITEINLIKYVLEYDEEVKILIFEALKEDLNDEEK